MMKFEYFLIQSREQQTRRITLEDEVEELKERLSGELKLNNVLRYALKGPVLSCPPLPSLLPLKVRTLLTELEMVENEIGWLESKLKKLKIRIYIEKKVKKKAELMQARKLLEMQLPCKQQIQGVRKEMGVWTPFCSMQNATIFSLSHVCQR